MNNNPDHIDQDPRDPATRAFDALRSELVDVRQSVESLDTSIQQICPYDYRKSLGQILRAQEGIEIELEGIKSHPAIRLTPDGFAHQLEKAKSELIKEDRRDLTILIDAHTHNCLVMKSYVESANESARQKLGLVGLHLCFSALELYFR